MSISFHYSLDLFSKRVAMLRFIVCVAFAAFCYAQVPTPCTSPKQWEGRRIREDRARSYFEMAKHSYDETNMRTRSIEEVDVNSTKDYFDVLHLHNVGKEYRLNLRTRQCNVSTLTRPFRYIGVPPDATFLFEANIGATGVPGESVTVETFRGKFEDNAEYDVTVTVPDCIPIAFDVRSSSGNESFHERYFDVNLGIADPMVFIPPEECNSR